MPRTQAHFISAEQRRREVAAILARGVLRLRRNASKIGFRHAPESAPDQQNCLELPVETRLSVSHGTHGLRLRDDGDDA